MNQGEFWVRVFDQFLFVGLGFVVGMKAVASTGVSWKVRLVGFLFGMVVGQIITWMVLVDKKPTRRVKR